MKLSRDIQSLSVFKRDSSKYIKQIKKTGEPLILTVNGKAAAVVIDPDSYEDLQREKHRQEMIASVNRGIEDARAGRTTPAEQVFREFEKKYKISR